MSEVPHDREALQRILYEIIASYDQAHARITVEGRRSWCGRRRTTTLGGDSELLRDAIRIGRIMLKENKWWPNECL